MKCPVCKTIVLHSLPQDESPARLVCDSCGGQWIKSFQYWKWLKSHGENLPEKPVDEGAQLLVDDSAAAMLCPECGQILMRRRVGHGVDFRIDRCVACGGFWFDQHEWDILKSRNLHDDVHFIFSAAWEHRITQQERQEAQNRWLENAVGDQEMARVREFKKWLTAHPSRDVILAFLRDKDE
ncbi:MAG: zf-TFIIB domain-containing protein [Candidatus Hydrogenedentes bacterium]|nr:zf-TFIIB domain-containing protein [Candidatus Hydrogenedentota bacterium]